MSVASFWPMFAGAVCKPTRPICFAAQRLSSTKASSERETAVSLGLNPNASGGCLPSLTLVVRGGMFLTANGRKWALIFQILVDIGRAQFVVGNGGVDGRGRRIAVIRVCSRPFAVLKLSRHARSKPRTRRWRRTAAPLLRSMLGRNSNVPFTIQRSCRAAVAQLFVRCEVRVGLRERLFLTTDFTDDADVFLSVLSMTSVV